MSDSRPAGLREKVLRGGAYLIVRQVLGLMIGFGGLILLTKLIGASNYGVYASAFGIITYLSNLANLGINVFLIRQEKDFKRDYYDQAFTLLFLTTLLVLSLGYIFTPLLSAWIQNPEFGMPFIALLFTLPINSLIIPSLARLEKDLNYRAVAYLELSGQIAFYAVSLPLALNKSGYWAPVTGYWVQQLIVMIGTLYMSKFIPKFTWSSPRIKEMIGYGIGYSSSIWVWQLRNLVNPLIVGRFAGPAAVGYVALAVKLVESLSFVKNITWRISISALAKLQGDSNRLRMTISEAMSTQVLVLGPFLAGFSLAAPWIIPVLFGENWLPVFEVYPFIALGTLVNAVFNMHSSVLYVLKRNWDVTLFHIGHILIFATGALIFVSEFGLVGYGYAEALSILGYFIIHHRLGITLQPSYRLAALWLAVFVPPLFTLISAPVFALLLWLPFVLVFFLKEPRQQLFSYLSYLRRGRIQHGR